MPPLTPEKLDHFNDFGFVIVEDVLDHETVIDPIIDEYSGVLDRLARELFDKGDISSTYDDLPFGERVIRIYEESQAVHNQYFDFSLPQKDVKKDTPFWAGPAC